MSSYQKEGLLVFINYYSTRTESFILSQLEFLRKKGLRYSILAYNYTGLEDGIFSVPIGRNFMERLTSLKLDSWQKVRLLLLSLKFRSGWNLSLYKTGLHFLDRQYDSIYCHFGTNGKLIAELKSLGIVDPQTQVVVQFHGLDLNRRKYGVDHYAIFNRWVSYVVYGSNLAFRLLQEFKVIKPKLLKIPVSIDFSKIADFEEERQIVDTVKLVSVGRLIPLKGHALALRMVRQLKSRTSKKIDFEIIGDGPMRFELQGMIEALGLSGEVKLSGWKSHEEVLKSLSDAHIYLYTGIADREGRVEMQGLANLEAMALGLVVVSTGVGGVGETLIDQENGIVVDANDLDNASDKLYGIVENYPDFRSLRHKARTHVFYHYNIEKVYQEVLDILLPN